MGSDRIREGDEMSKDCIEFWLHDKVLARVDSSFAPTAGQYVNIKKKNYRITQVSFSLDHLDEVSERAMRCNAQIVEPK